MEGWEEAVFQIKFLRKNNSNNNKKSKSAVFQSVGHF